MGNLVNECPRVPNVSTWMSPGTTGHRHGSCRLDDAHAGTFERLEHANVNPVLHLLELNQSHTQAEVDDLASDTGRRAETIPQYGTTLELARRLLRHRLRHDVGQLFQKRHRRVLAEVHGELRAPTRHVLVIGEAALRDVRVGEHHSLAVIGIVVVQKTGGHENARWYFSGPKSPKPRSGRTPPSRGPGSENSFFGGVGPSPIKV